MKINSDQLMNLLSDLEFDRIERTISTKDTDKFSIAVCAFSNNLSDHKTSGYLIIGARDDGTIDTSVDITDQLVHNLSALCFEANILPLLLRL